MTDQASQTPQASQAELERAVQRLNARAWGITGGILFGGGLLIATLILVIKGGPDPGRHLGLLGNYFPGYRVTVPGSLIGFVYGFVVGYGAGRLVGTLYNKMVE